MYYVFQICARQRVHGDLNVVIDFHRNIEKSDNKVAYQNMEQVAISLGESHWNGTIELKRAFLEKSIFPWKRVSSAVLFLKTLPGSFLKSTKQNGERDKYLKKKES